MKSIGICIGASSVSFVLLEKKHNISPVKSFVIPHDGNPKSVITKILDKHLIDSVDNIIVTGRKFRNMVNFASISEPEAVEFAFKHHFKNTSESGKPDVVISAGGETFLVYLVDKKGEIINLYTGNKCASGTGEFFLQQIKRMNLDIENAIKIADIDNPYKLSGRCSVFCKSDCTHALNKGMSKSSVVAGLCKVMSDKILELLNSIEYENVYIIGGTTDNSTMINFLKQKIPNLIVPEFAKVFEAFGAAICGFYPLPLASSGGDISTAKTGITNSKNQMELEPHQNVDELFSDNTKSFAHLPMLSNFTNKVTFKPSVINKHKKNDTCILGLDVGSTTTKAVLLRLSDNAIVASCYLRTNGNPILASRECYKAIYDIVSNDVDIIGLSVTGSGRQISGLHAQTPAIINEIIAHATAAVYFDKEVDTIFEIGGQDAKYTYITNQVASDYAMNEACSAGTGSFLEESAKESLNIDYLELQDSALKSTCTPNFNDQCAAFISSDIKSAVQEGFSKEDIAAGLVFSVCMNYSNRVKGNRPVGKKIFMQGGVCYNKAVPIAMAAITGKEIIVPPEPGLMGAFGVALELKKRLELKLIEPMNFSLKELSEREVSYKPAFICAGGKEKCDRKCSINRIEVNNKTFSFGGACNKYYNLIAQKNEDTDYSENDLVELREHLLFNKFGKEYAKPFLPKNNTTVGINLSLLTNTLFPLYYNFFVSLGFDVILSPGVDNTGFTKKGAAFCYPVEIAHGAVSALIKENPDIYFLPHVKLMPVNNAEKERCVCPFVQSEPYYLKSAFPELNDKTVLMPLLSFKNNYESGIQTFIDIGEKLNISKNDALKAFNLAVTAQNEFHAECRKIGQKVLDNLAKDPNDIAIVLFGRPYNAFSKIANMGISKKFATKGYKIIPSDFLPLNDEKSTPTMYWAMGDGILKAARFIQRHKQLFGTFITNFSCGPDSFVLTFFRDIQKTKPSLCLELDSHTADAGIDTRIEAFIDVVKNYMEIMKKTKEQESLNFKPTKVELENGKYVVHDSFGGKTPLTDEKITLLLPSMGFIESRLIGAAFKSSGINAVAATPPNESELKTGRGLCSCKECLPLILVTGTLINYIENHKKDDEKVIYFMTKTNGPCRMGQYHQFLSDLILKQKIPNVAVLSLSDENNYKGIAAKTMLKICQSLFISEVMQEIYSVIITLASDKNEALKTFDDIINKIEYCLIHKSYRELKKTLQECSKTLGTIKLSSPLSNTPKVLLTGEIYVRSDGFSRQFLVERLAEKNIAVKTSPVIEFLYYIDYLTKTNKLKISSLQTFIETLKRLYKRSVEKTIKTIFATSGLYEYHEINIAKLISTGKNLVSEDLHGETILTIGATIAHLIEDVSGVISIGPFGCMPLRIAESVLSKDLNSIKYQISNNELVKGVMSKYPTLPFISIESDGNVFPQIIETRIETFCLQVNRIHEYSQRLKKYIGNSALKEDTNNVTAMDTNCSPEYE